MRKDITGEGGGVWTLLPGSAGGQGFPPDPPAFWGWVTSARQAQGWGRTCAASWMARGNKQCPWQPPQSRPGLFMEQISSRLCYRDGGDGADPSTGAGPSGIPPPKTAEQARGSGAGMAVIWKLSFKKPHFLPILFFFYFSVQINLPFLWCKSKPGGTPPAAAVGPMGFFQGLGVT